MENNEREIITADFADDRVAGVELQCPADPEAYSGLLVTGEFFYFAMADGKCVLGISNDSAEDAYDDSGMTGIECGPDDMMFFRTDADRDWYFTTMLDARWNGRY